MSYAAPVVIKKEASLRPVVVGSLGNLIEYYDAFAYAAFALYFAPAFFPNSDAVAQQLSAAVLFAVAFLMRPIGGVLFGWLADSFGRKMALLTSVLMMTFGSVMMAVTPNFATIGVAAPILLGLARILQGLSQGGEYGASATYLAEISPGDRRGLYSGIWYMTLIGGQLVALLILLGLQSVLTAEELRAWGWRLPFLFGGALSLFAFSMRRDMPETKTFAVDRARTRIRNPLPLFLSHWRGCILVVGWTIGGTSAVYTYTSYMQKFLKLSVGLDDTQSAWITAGGLLVAVTLQPIYGALSDRVGRKPMLIWFGVTGTLLTYPLLVTLQSTRSPLVAFLLICSAWVIVSGYTSVAAIVKAELFPTSIRALGVGVPYALTVSLFGGSIDATALTFKASAHENWFFIYASACIAISLLFYIPMRETRHNSPLDTAAT
jgi:MHS family alpha-ketoglutarate permease-like MFS transporter